MNKRWLKLLNMLQQPESRVTLAQLYSKAVSFAIFALISRNMGATDYAHFVLIFAIISMITEIGSSGLLQGVLRYAATNQGNVEQYAEITTTSLVNGVVIAILLQVLLGLVYVFSPQSILNGIVTWMALFLFAITLMSIANTLFNGFGEYGRLFFSLATNSTALLCFVTIAYLAQQLTPANLILCYSLSALCSVGLQAFFLRPRLQIAYKPQITSAIFGFGKWYLLWAVFSILENKIDIFVLAKFASKEQLAAFDVSSKFLQIMQLLFNSSAMVAMPELIAADQNNELLSNVRSKIKNTIKKLIWINIALVPITTISIHFYYSGRYELSTICYIIQACGLVPFIMTLRPSTELYRLNKPKYLVAISCAVGIIKMITSAILVAYFAAIGAALAFVVTQLASLMLFNLTVKKITKIA